MITWPSHVAVNGNKYTKWYENIIKKSQIRNWETVQYYRKKDKSVYSELHHIIPKSFGGTNAKDNLVALTPKEHFICHWLLTKMVNGTYYHKMLFALNGMNANPTSSNKRYTTKNTSRVYQQTKEILSKIPTPPEVREKQRESAKKRTHTPETKAKISAANKGRKMTAESIEKSASGHRNKPLSEEHKQNISMSKKAYEMNKLKMV